jgi:hypothetical protein
MAFLVLSDDVCLEGLVHRTLLRMGLQMLEGLANFYVLPNVLLKFRAQ